MAPSKPTLSTLERVGLFGSFFKTVFSTISTLVAASFQHAKRAPSSARHLSFAVSRAYSTSYSAKALAARGLTTDEGYESFVASQNITPNSVTLVDGTRAHWLGDPSAEKLLLFFHGGGYVLYAVDGHFQLLQQTICSVEDSGGKLAVLVLAYDVSVQAPYPRQLQQAAALLDHAITVLGKKPENILLVGDSAGGNLTLALVSHILHPHPTVEPVEVSGQFAGIALLSPWVTFDTNSDSMRANRISDVIAIPSLNKWASIFRGDAASDPYLEPLSAPENWWQSFPARNVLLLAGADEVFVDDIQHFAKQLGNAPPNVVLKIVPKEAHDHLVLEFMLKETRSKQREEFEKWIRDVVCTS